MQRLALTCYSCLLVLGLAACDKSTDKQPADAKQDTKQAKQDAKPADAPKPAEPAKTEAKTEVVDDTKGLANVAREVAGDTTPASPDAGKASDAPRYDTSQDEGGMIGHIATALAHDEDLADAATTKELAKLAGEADSETASDDQICKQVSTAVVGKAYPDLGDAEPKFIAACKAEIEKQRIKLGVEIFTQHAECMVAATDIAALDLCDAAEQAAEDALHANPHGDQPDEKLCIAGVEQMFILINRDIGDDVDLLEELEEDIEAIKDDAKLVCHDEATKAELACIMKSAKLAELESC